MNLNTGIMAEPKKILIYGYGNPGRQDDGLGKALIDIAEMWAEEMKLEHLTLDTNYLLQVEDVLLMRDKDLVIFVDASMEEHVRDYHFEEVEPDSKATFTMHSVSPGYILALYQKLFGEHPPSFLLHIKGYRWELGESITPEAEQNLEQAWVAIKKIILDPDKLLAKVCNTAI